MNSEAASRTWDCIVVGAGPAGLNAALVLGRARRRVLVLDSAHPRNYATHEMHGVLGHDGLDPADLRARGRAELARYGVEVVTAEVERARRCSTAASASLSARGADVARTVLLATGMLDEVPDIPGFADVWGTSAHTCPYCDGFEHRDERLAVLAAGARGEHLAIAAAPVVRRRRPAQQRPARPRRRPARARAGPRHPHHRDAGRRAGQRRHRAPASRPFRRRRDARPRRAVLLRRLAAAHRASPARWAASCATTAPSPSTQARRRPSTASTPPATAPTRERSSRRPPAPAPPPRSPSTRA